MILQLSDLEISYTTGTGSDSRRVDAVDGVSLAVGEGETFGLVGESGCGKSTIARSIIDILPDNGWIRGGEVRFRGEDLTEVSPARMREIRWNDISIVPQSSMHAFDPVYTVGDQIREAMRIHTDMDRAAMDEKIAELFGKMSISTDRIDDYPHQFSGGMKQRAMIAMAIALDPDLIIADEPTTALDVISQDTILYYLEELQRETDAAMLFISHDISVVAELCDTIGVMYAGEVIESGPVEDVLREPLHPYTIGLKNAFPTTNERRELISIPGSPPDLVDMPEACRFAPRCPFADDGCREESPRMERYGEGRQAACLRIDELGADRMRERGRDPATWEERRLDGATVGGDGRGRP